jgi:hypothetical protein
VFYSNSGAPVIQRMIRDANDRLQGNLEAARRESRVKKACADQDIARRFEELLDLVE